VSARGALVGAALCVSGLAAAQPPARELLEQKESFVRRLLGDARTAQRIAASGSAEAREQVESARTLHARSLEHLRRGELGDADARLNDAMRALGRARQLAPDRAQMAIERRLANERVLSSVEGLRESYARHLRRLLGLGADGPVRDALLEEVSGRIEDARRLMGGERHAEAALALQKAGAALLHGLNRILDSATLDYALRFDTPADEYAYERERNRGYAKLVPTALAELRPSTDAMQLVNRYLESNEAMVALAERQAAAREWTAALGNVKTATAYLQRALGAAGLAVPQAIVD
jgi:hypothetical protein